MDIYKRLYIKSIYHSAKLCGRITMMIINELQRYLRVVYMQKNATSCDRIKWHFSGMQMRLAWMSVADRLDVYLLLLFYLFGIWQAEGCEGFGG